MTHAEYAVQLWTSAPKMPDACWQVVGFFYAAVHGVNHALFGGADVNWSHDHGKREFEMDRHQRLRPLLGKYRALRKESEVARYKPWQHPFNAARTANARNLAAEVLQACGIEIPPASAAKAPRT